MKNGQHEVHLNLNVRGLPISATLGINEESNRLISEGKQVYKLGLGQSPFPVPEPIVRELQNNAHQKDYLPVRGLPALCDAVAGYYRRTQDLPISKGNILIGPGSKELMFILQLVYYGDLVIPTPSWVSYAPQAHIVGRHVHWLETDEKNNWLLTPEELEHFCAADPSKPRIVILNYPNNPTGCSYAPHQLQALAEVARKYRIILLSDEIYGELNFAGCHQSIARYYPEGTIIASGLSKWAGAGGWRLGTFAFPEELKWLMESMTVVASETFTATSAPIQYAAVKAFEGSVRLERYLFNSRKILSALADWIWSRLSVAGVTVARPDGAFYMLPDFEPFRENLEARGITNGEVFCQQLLQQTGVAILPGSSFGRPKRELTARLAFVDFDGARALAAVEQFSADQPVDEAYLRVYCERVLTAIDKLCDWIE
ncbi:MAG: aminotransferase class I/II-fold pyridoxal phosphate-dependent enzyme [Deltaproteobacteria bacterium]|nr:aminotransferase class I/II-fold pyridoxal phosphate-dependent enzyme [Deltaproteobacteria bacterium]MCW9049953.1 aminotransferase class I/II-fold pyridoxal phosphate-dependent enzyme [Deltaproteobacteria bacterium]